MFKKNKCKKCGEKINDKYSFCPYCGKPVNSDKKEWGMLGKNDYDGISSENLFLGGISGSMLGKMFNSAMKMLEKEIQKENSFPKTNFRLRINGKEIKLKNQDIKRQKVEKKITTKTLPQKILKKFSKLPKIEPKTDLRRLSDKIFYEIDMPGVKSLNEISISQLENSIEIKAISKDKAYHKIIPINLPIINYNLSKEKLVLELISKN